MTSPHAANPTLSLIRCGLAAESYGVDMTWVRGIYGADRLRRKPDANGQIGMLLEAGGDIPVFDLGQQLRRPEKRSTTQGHIIVFPSPTGNWGLLVDRVSRVVRVPREQLYPMAPLLTAAVPQLQGVLLLDDDMVLMLAPDRLTHKSPMLHTAVVEEPPSTRNMATDAPTPNLPAPLGAHALQPYQEPVAPTAGGKQRRRLVLFSTSDPGPRERPLSFAVSLAQVLEVLEPLPLVQVPLAPPSILGIARWRNQPVPILDLATSLGLPPSAQDRRSRLLIVRVPRTTAKVGLLVRPSVRLLPLPTPHGPCRERLPLPSHMVLASVDLAGETVVIPNLSTIWHAAS